MDLLLAGTLEEARIADKEKYEAYMEKVAEGAEDLDDNWLELENATYD